jgi:hypothetical protein
MILTINFEKKVVFLHEPVKLQELNTKLERIFGEEGLREVIILSNFNKVINSDNS